MLECYEFNLGRFLQEYEANESDPSPEDEEDEEQ